MTPRPLRLPLALLAAALLAGCSHEDASTTAAKSATSAYAAVARGSIDVEGGLLRLSVPVDGIVAQVDAHEGDHVRKGQALAQLDTEAARLSVSAAQAEQQQAEAQVNLLEVRVKAAQLRAQRLSEAAKAGAGDAQSADDAQENAQQLQGELDNANASVALAAQKLAAARYQLSLRSLLAPTDAMVVRRLIQPGATVSPASGPVFVLLPDGARIVRAELNESFVGVVHSGMHAEVVDDGGTGMPTLQAHVLRIGEVFGASQLEDDPQLRGSTRTVECVLAFDQPPPTNLRIGQRVLVRFAPDKAR